jgi:hypothetical protein
VNRLILALAVLALAHPVLAQPDDWSYGRREARDARAAQREARREARDAARDARRDAWDARTRDRRGVHLRLLRSYTLRAGEVTREPIVVIGGSATIDGRAEEDVVVIGGTLKVGPAAVILGDAVSVGGETIVDPAATIAGEVDETIVVWPDFDFNWSGLSTGWWAAASLGATLLRLGLVLFVSLFITLLSPRWTGSIGARLWDAPGASLFVGVTSQLLFVPVMILLTIVLIITIVGIPLLLTLPFLLAFAALVWTAGFAAVAGRAGARLRGQFAGTSSSPALDLLTGFTVITSVTVVAHLLALGPWWLQPAWIPLHIAGWLIEWLAWTVGLGAALTSYMGRRLDAPPAIPIMSQPAPSAM